MKEWHRVRPSAAFLDLKRYFCENLITVANERKRDETYTDRGLVYTVLYFENAMLNRVNGCVSGQRHYR